MLINKPTSHRIIQISASFLPHCPTDNDWASVQQKAWCETTPKSLLKPTITLFTTAYMCHQALIQLIQIWSFWYLQYQFIWILRTYIPNFQGKEHYSDILMSAMASQITSLTIVYSTAWSKKTSKLHVTGLCEGNSPGTSELLAHRASNAENVSIWWHHHEIISSSTMILTCSIPFYTFDTIILDISCL